MNTLNLFAANDPESDDMIENVNRALWSYYNRSRLYDRRSANEMILGEALYEKDLSRVSNNASAFELLYSRSLRMIPEIFEQCSTSSAIKEHAKHFPVGG